MRVLQVSVALSFKYVICILVFGLCFATPVLGETNVTKTIHRLVRTDEEGNTVLRKISVREGEKTKEVMEWLSRNRQSLEGTKPGPFASTQQYVSRFKENKI